MTIEQSTFTAQVASGGTALGLSYRTDRPVQVPLPTRGGGDTVERVISAFDFVAERLAALSTQLRARGRVEQADLMEVSGYIALDPDLREEAIRRAKRGEPAAVAVRQAVAHYAETIAALDDPILADRAADVRQIGKRALAWLNGDNRARPEGPLVLIAEEIGASELLEPEFSVVAALSVAGGPNSHAAIVARSLSIPLLTGIDPALLELADGVEILVDGEHGRIRTDPLVLDREAALLEMARARSRRATYLSERRLSSHTVDAHRVTLRANVATVDDARAAVEAGAEGVGLLRTELPFLDATRWPTEIHHRLVLGPVLRQLAGRSVTVRTLDFSDDKLPPFLAAVRQGRPLGRCLPLMLAQPEALIDQFRAILGSITASTDLRIMLPMVADRDELESCRLLLQEAAASLGVGVPPLGIMIELREAVERADELAEAAAFVSIGSNDLTGQILGLDRRDPAATPKLAAHPYVLGAIARVVEAAHHYGRQVSVCGDAAANPVVVPLLVGLGCDILSLTPAGIDEIRYRIRRLRYEQCRQLAAQALRCDSAQQVWALVHEQLAG